jgi:RNA-directed DNA polymerase
VSPKTVWRTVYEGHRRLWALSHTSAVNRGLRNAYIAERGLIFLADWFTVHNDWGVIAPEGAGFQPRLPLG